MTGRRAVEGLGQITPPSVNVLVCFRRALAPLVVRRFAAWSISMGSMRSEPRVELKAAARQLSA